MSNPIKFRLELTQEELENELSILNNSENLELSGDILPINPNEVPSQSLVDTGFIEAVAIIVIGTVAYLAKRLVDHWLKKKEKGVIIDARETPVRISTLENIPFGTLVLIDQNGNASSHKTKDKRTLIELISDFTSIIEPIFN